MSPWFLKICLWEILLQFQIWKLALNLEIFYLMRNMTKIWRNLLALVYHQIYFLEELIVSGKSSLDVLKLSTTHDTIEQHLVDTKSELTLSHDEYSIDFCDKEELCDSSMFIPVPTLVKETDPFILEPKTL